MDQIPCPEVGGVDPALDNVALASERLGDEVVVSVGVGHTGVGVGSTKLTDVETYSVLCVSVSRIMQVNTKSSSACIL